MEQQAYHMSPAELKRLQETQMELIAEVDRICKKCNIRYNMVGGTMLGAIRHKGYIPWDDDADIGFLREEYEKFREACRTELDPEKYYIQDLRDTNGYRWGYGKLRRCGTEFIRLNQEKMPYGMGISIDLMPFDNVPDGAFARQWHFLRCYIYRKFFWSRIGKDTAKHWWQRLCFRLMDLVPMEYLVASFSSFIDQCRQYGQTELVRILTFPTPKGEGFFGYERRWYDDLAEYEFDKLKLPGAADYDGYLTVKYGNYMELPPENKRKIHPISKLTLLSEQEGMAENGKEI
ncbi:phosphorylcholine transferase LicD [Anaerovibrio sp. RM50]|uniref:LicD family protein n=1 Tax=Anaerovibrio sp. RM50 TaxID=1200557 RepID=UPI0006890AEA|nr:LicD family protein [Anaerovibrio sp. RM50]